MHSSIYQRGRPVVYVTISFSSSATFSFHFFLKQLRGLEPTRDRITGEITSPPVERSFILGEIYRWERSSIHGEITTAIEPMVQSQGSKVRNEVQPQLNTHNVKEATKHHCKIGRNQLYLLGHLICNHLKELKLLKYITKKAGGSDESDQKYKEYESDIGKNNSWIANREKFRQPEAAWE